MAVGKVQTPRFGIAAWFSVGAPTIPVKPFVRNSNSNPTTPAPLHLPIAARGDGLPGQHLSPAAKFLQVFWIVLRLVTGANLSVALGQVEVGVGSVWVQRHFTADCR